MFLNSFNIFRAIAIVIIVIGHCDIFFIDVRHDMFTDLFYILSFGGTSLFVFISGFLFNHIFLERYNYKKFVRKKMTKVLLPYTIMSLIPIANYVFIKGKDLSSDSYFMPKGDDVFTEYFIPAIKYYTSGEQMMAYWYIPFIMVVFFMSPVHVYFSKWNIKLQLLILAVSIFFSTLIHRPIISAGLYLFQSVLYFTPIYLFGIVCSQQKDFIYKKFQRKEHMFLMISILLGLIQYKNGVVGNYHKNPFVFNGFDLMILQKSSLCLFFMIWLHRFERNKNKTLQILASNSFGIFFIHGFVIFFMRKLQIKYEISMEFNFWISYTLIVGLVLLISTTISLVIKKIFPKKSVYIIGC